METATKTCSRCKRSLPSHEFYADKRNRDGLKNPCKKCMRQVFHAYHCRNRELLAAKQRAYYAEHKEQYRITKIAWSANNADVIRRKKADYARLHRDAIKEYRAAYYLAHKDSLRAKHAAWQAANKARCNELKRKSRLANLERSRAKNNGHQSRYRERMTDCYIATLICDKTSLRRNDIPDALIDAKRAQLQLLRKLRELRRRKP